MNTWKISPRFTNQKLTNSTLADKIDIFEDRMNGWFIDHAKQLASSNYSLSQHAGMAVLMIVFAYFETIECYFCGTEAGDVSREFFKRGFRRVFDLPTALRSQGHRMVNKLADQIADDIYKQLRCGLYHEASISNKVFIRPVGPPIELSIHLRDGSLGGVIINPSSFTSEVERHLDTYVLQLRDPRQAHIRKNFERFFDLSTSRPPIVIPS